MDRTNDTQMLLNAETVAAFAGLSGFSQERAQGRNYCLCCGVLNGHDCVECGKSIKQKECHSGEGVCIECRDI